MKKILKSKLIAILLLSFNLNLAQVTVPVNFGIPTNYVGWNAGQGFSLRVEHKGNQNIHFFTGLAGLAAQRMTIRGVAGPTQGFVSIGQNFTTPQWQLDVNNNMNLNINYAFPGNAGFGYRIRGQKILSNPNTGINTNQNIFVGVNAGSIWVPVGANSYSYCTFVGENAGIVNRRSYNTFLGRNSGVVNSTGEFNTFVGDESGMLNTTGFQNTFVGHHSGINNTSGALNTYVGEHAAGAFGNNSSGSFNTAVGGWALGDITTGDANSVFGAGAGISMTTGGDNCIFGFFQSTGVIGGSRNVYVGSEGGGWQGGGGFFNSNGNNNVNIGFRAGYFVQNQSDYNIFLGSFAGIGPIGTFSNLIVIGGGTNTGLTISARGRASNNMILGNNRIRVGIGMSDVAGGPQNKLELNCDIPTSPPIPFTSSTTFNPAIPGSWPGGGTGASGLRFRDLTSTSTVVPISSYSLANIIPTKVLSVDGNGDVVLINPTATVLTNNGISTNSLGVVQLGINCPETNTAIVSQFQLINNRQIPMNNFNLTFSNTVGGFVQGFNSVGVGSSCTPGNRLEVDRNTGPSAISGLRLTQFIGAVPTTSTNTVLAVNASGDVILTTVPTSTAPGSGIGNYCGATPNPLVGADYEIPLNTFKYRFTGQGIIAPAPAGPQQDQVSVGYPCFTGLPVAKFCVKDTQQVQPVPFTNYSAHFRNRNEGGGGTTNIITGGVYGEAIRILPPTTFSVINIGGVFQGAGSSRNVGVLGRVTGLLPPTLNAALGPYNIGGMFLSDSAQSTHVNYGVYAKASNTVAGFNPGSYGVYAEVPNSSSTYTNYAIYGRAVPGGTIASYAGYFDGNVNINGSLTFLSDQNFKQNINPLTNGLNIINQLQPKTFNYNSGSYPQISFPNGLQYGLLAQQVQTVLPAIVNNNTHPATEFNGTSYPAQPYLGLEYQQFIPILIKAVQELSSQNNILIQQNNTQDSLIAALTQSIIACCENSESSSTMIKGGGPAAEKQVMNLLNIDLSDKDVIVLNQNIPNPYAEHTIITYNVPLQYKYAQIIFKTVDGKIIKAVDIEKKGRGQLNVFANDLSNGLYMYTLIVDGKEFDTKKMIKQN